MTALNLLLEVVEYILTKRCAVSQHMCRVKLRVMFGLSHRIFQAHVTVYHQQANAIISRVESLGRLNSHSQNNHLRQSEGCGVWKESRVSFPLIIDPSVEYNGA